MTILETRFRPPYNLFSASIFFCWLFGSISFDLFKEQERDTALFIVFLILTLISIHLFLRSARSLIFFNRTGLKITGKDVIYREPGFFKVISTNIIMKEITEIDVSDGSILIRYKGGDLILRSKNFLLGQESVLHALRSDPDKLSLNQIRGNLTNFEGIKCSSCGASLRIDINNDKELICDYCNNNNSVTEKISDSLKLLREALRSVPESIRQLGKKGEGKLVVTGLRSAKGMRTAAYITLGVWSLFGSVELISSLLRKNVDINYKFIGISIILGIFTLLSAIVLSVILKRIIKRLSFKYQADPMPEGKASCRLCGGELPGSGLIRRCSWCNTDNIAEQSSLKEYNKNSVISMKNIRDRLFRTVSDTERLITITADQLILITAAQFFWLHIPVLVMLDGSSGMIMKITPLFILFTIGAFLLLIKGSGELKELDSKGPADK